MTEDGKVLTNCVAVLPQVAEPHGPVPEEEGEEGGKEEGEEEGEELGEEGVEEGGEKFLY